MSPWMRGARYLPAFLYALITAQLHPALGQTASPFPSGVVEMNGLKARAAVAEDVLGAWIILDLKGKAGPIARYVVLRPNNEMFSLTVRDAASRMTEKQIGELLPSAKPTRYLFNDPGFLALNQGGDLQEIGSVSLIVDAPAGSTAGPGDLLFVVFGPGGRPNLQIMQRLRRE